MLPYVLTGLAIIIGLPGATLNILLLFERRKRKRNHQSNDHLMPS
jgi:hypothetical protein